MIIDKALIGCRVKPSSKGKSIDGIIVGATGSDRGRLFFIIMRKDGTFTDRDLTEIAIHKDDYRKVMQESIPEPIESRSEILDL